MTTAEPSCLYHDQAIKWKLASCLLPFTIQPRIQVLPGWWDWQNLNTSKNLPTRESWKCKLFIYFLLLLLSSLCKTWRTLDKTWNACKLDHSSICHKYYKIFSHTFYTFLLFCREGIKEIATRISIAFYSFPLSLQTRTTESFKTMKADENEQLPLTTYF